MDQCNHCFKYHSPFEVCNEYIKNLEEDSMTDEFKKARDEAADRDCDMAPKYGGVLEDTYIKGADWAYEWCEKEMVPGTMKVVFKKKAEIEKQQAIIDKLKETVVTVMNQPFEGSWDAQAVFISKALTDIKKMEEGK